MAVPYIFGLQTPTNTLDTPQATNFTAIGDNSIISVTAGQIPAVVWIVPSSTLATPLSSIIDNSTSADIKTITAGTSTNYGARVPSVGIGSVLSTHIYTSDTLISIGNASSQTSTSTQSWYMS